MHKPFFVVKVPDLWVTFIISVEMIQIQDRILCLFGTFKLDQEWYLMPIMHSSYACAEDIAIMIYVLFG